MEVFFGLLYAFGIGIAFAGGSLVTAYIAANWLSKERVKLDKEIQKHNNIVEKRLEGYVANTARIAAALEFIQDKG